MSTGRTPNEPVVNDPWERLAALERWLEQLTAQLEALDASFVRHQGQNEDDSRRADQAVDRVGSDHSQHLTDHWRAR